MSFIDNGSFSSVELKNGGLLRLYAVFIGSFVCLKLCEKCLLDYYPLSSEGSPAFDWVGFSKVYTVIYFQSNKVFLVNDCNEQGDLKLQGQDFHQTFIPIILELFITISNFIIGRISILTRHKSLTDQLYIIKMLQKPIS